MEEVGEVAEGVPDGAHLPVEDAGDVGGGGVEDDVVDLVVAVDEGGAVAGAQGGVGEEGHQLVHVRDLADGLPCVDVARPRLRVADLPPRRQLPVVEPAALAEGTQPHAVRVHAVQGSQGLDGGAPEIGALLGVRGRGHGGVFEDPPADEGHDVEGRADDGHVLAEAVGSGHGDVGVLEGGDDAVFALDLVGGLGDELARWLLAQDVSRPVRRGELVCRIRLAEAELGGMC